MISTPSTIARLSLLQFNLVVRDPDGNSVGIVSEVDDSTRRDPGPRPVLDVLAAGSASPRGGAATRSAPSGPDGAHAGRYRMSMNDKRMVVLASMLAFAVAGSACASKGANAPGNGATNESDLSAVGTGTPGGGTGGGANGGTTPTATDGNMGGGGTTDSAGSMGGGGTTGSGTTGSGSSGSIPRR